jgi:SAM-dependent methyltransferase
MNPYRQRVWSLILDALPKGQNYKNVLDFGCGDAWFSHQFEGSGLAARVTPVDVKRRDNVWVEPKIYDGGTLPFADGEFDLAYAIDVVHHCPDPIRALRELARCSSRYLMLKDHTFRNPYEKFVLAILDELGNRKFGIPSPYGYQKDWEWHDLLLSQGWRSLAMVHPAGCHTGLTGKLTNHLQYVALYERV